MRTTVRGRAFVDGEVRAVAIEVEGDRIDAVTAEGMALGPLSGATFAPGATILPGAVDLHCHGGGGATFIELDPASAEAAARHQHQRGTTSLLASLVSLAPDDLARGVEVLADLADDGLVDGIHLEGPWISAARCGAHDPALLRDPDLAETDRLLELGRGHVRQVTLAPERPGGLDLVRHLAASGVHPAIGHSGAPYGLVLDAVDAGADLATHLFNGMDPWHHRQPGAVPALLRAAREGRVTLELIADGVHIADETARTVADLVGAEQVAFVSDAMGAAGMGDGRYVLGGLVVLVSDGVARLDQDPGVPGPGSLAGGTSHVIDILLRQVRAGTDLARAVQSACATPARFLRLADRGVIAPGARADLVVVDETGEVQRVMRAGRWLGD